MGAEALGDFFHGGGDFLGDGGGDFAFVGVVFEVDEGVEDGVADFEGGFGVFSVEDVDIVFVEEFPTGEHDASAEDEGFSEAHTGLEVKALDE